MPFSRIHTALAGLLLLASAGATHTATAQPNDPVRWTFAPKSAPVFSGDTVLLTLTANIDAGFHMYAFTQSEEGPYPLTIRAVDDAVVKTSGAVIGPKAEKIPTSSFGVPVEWYSTRASFRIPIRIAPTSASSTIARVSVRYQSCSNTVCMLPRTIELTQTLALRAR